MKPQATVWVCVPKASSHQFHPFTVSNVLDSYDASKPTIAKLAIKPYGKWAKVIMERYMSSANMHQLLHKVPGSLYSDLPLCHPCDVVHHADLLQL